MTYGMNFTNSGADVVKNPTYTTTDSRIQMDITNQAPLFDVIKISAGTNLVVLPQTGGTNTATETLKIINHNLGFTPSVYITFYLTPIKSSNDPSTFSGTYGLYQMWLYETGTISEYIKYKVDGSTLTFIHEIDNSSAEIVGPGTTYTGIAGDYDIQIKYLIANNLQVQTTVLH